MIDKLDFIPDGQMTIFDFLPQQTESYKITKPVRLIELFSGVGHKP